MMTPVFIVLIPTTLIFVAVIAFLFWKALNAGQFDDLDKAADHLQLDDDRDIVIRNEDNTIKK